MRLFQTYGTAEQIIRHVDDFHHDLSESTAALLRRPPWAQIEKERRWATADGHDILTWADRRYPAALLQIPSPPPVLFVRGDTNCLNAENIAVVGTRKPTITGINATMEITTGLLKHAFNIVSGLALGIDTRAHETAVNQGGATIAVIGTGIDRCYPARQKTLAERICAHGGAIVPEFPLGTPPKREHFPRRNRIISGLSRGTVVVEAATRSGSLITAYQALEQGREVFAVPGSIFNPQARGCHALIRQGAKLVETADDIIEELRPLTEAALTKPQSENCFGHEQERPSGHGGILYDCLGHEPTPIETLTERCRLPVDKVMSELMVLELHGWIKAMPGGLYIRCR